MAIETSDGAVVLVHYRGRVDGSKGLGGRAGLCGSPVRAKGTLEDNVVVYDVYERR